MNSNKPPSDNIDPTPEALEGGQDLISVSPTWALGLMIAACATGVGLLAVGLWSESPALDGHLSSLLIVSGLALIFAAFGSQANVQYKGWVIAGSGAIALIFLFAIDYLRRDAIVVVELQSTKIPTTTIRAGNVIIKGTVDAAGEFLRTRFFVRYSEVNNNEPRFDVEMPKKVNESENPVHPICFARAQLARGFGRGEPLDWHLDEIKLEVHDRKRKLIGRNKDCGLNEFTSSVGLPSLAISSAHAQGAANIEALIQDLLSENIDVRRLSRQRLAGEGPPIIRPLMDQAKSMTASNHPLASRMQVGAAVAIENLITKGGKTISPAENPALSKAVREQLTESDFETLIEWVLSVDGILKWPATRIVWFAADLPVLRLLAKETEKRLDGNPLYDASNTAMVLHLGAIRYVEDAAALAEIKQLAKQLKSRTAGSETRDILDKIDVL